MDESQAFVCDYEIVIINTKWQNTSKNGQNLDIIYCTFTFKFICLQRTVLRCIEPMVQLQMSLTDQ